jgi:hypothetical protein
MAEGNVHTDSRNEGYLIRKHTMDGPHKKASNRLDFIQFLFGEGYSVG